MKALVIGYGNPLRGDDGFGWEVVRRLAALRANDPRLHFLTACQPMPEHAEAVSAVQRVVFVDASREDEPGSWRASKVVAVSGAPVFAHALDAPGLLACARDFYGEAPEAILVSAGGQSFDCQETLTSHVEAIVPDVVDYIDGLLAAVQPHPTHA